MGVYCPSFRLIFRIYLKFYSFLFRFYFFIIYAGICFRRNSFFLKVFSGSGISKYLAFLISTFFFKLLVYFLCLLETWFFICNCRFFIISAITYSCVTLFIRFPKYFVITYFGCLGNWPVFALLFVKSLSTFVNSVRGV